MDAHHIVVITGLSGAGRSVAANALEDLGYFCIDNMPAALLTAFADLCVTDGPTLGRVALVIDIREREFFERVPTQLRTLETAGLAYEVVFLEATTDTLVRRYSESRRRHPMTEAADDLRGAIEAEREKLCTLRGQATAVIDTSDLNVHQLRERMRERYSDARGVTAMQVHVVSFGYKYGVPPEVDLLFDARFLPNPHYDAALRPLTGLDAPVREFVLGAAVTGEFLSRVAAFLDFVLPAYRQEGKSYLTIGMGCTGGRHRSVALAVALAALLAEGGVSRQVHVQHRDLLRAVVS